MFRIYLQDIDHKIFRFLNSLGGKSDSLDQMYVVFAEYFVYLMIAGFALFVLLKDSKERRKITLQAFVAGFLGRAVFDSIIYLFYFRPRPFVSGIVNQLVYHNPLEPAFPSGHTTVMFALAFSLLYINKKWAIAYLFLAAISSFSRVVVGVHYPFDVFAGILVGAISAIAANWLFGTWFSRKRKAK